MEPPILHELCYAPPHYLRQMRKADVAAYLRMALGWSGIRGEVEMMVEAVQL